MEWWQAALVALVSTLGTVGAAKVAGYYSSRAAEKTAEVQQDANAVTGYHTLVADLRADLTRLRTDLNGLEKKHEALEAHVIQLEVQRGKDKALIRYLIDYARRLRSELTARDLPVPEVPAGIDLDDEQPI